MEENNLVLKSVNQLFEYSFFIPSYQRGYRWTKTQVTQLLEDIWNFAKNPPKHQEGKEKPFYCLQPIVVKTHDSSKNEWEVIDGQQRLTTIFLILKNLEQQIERDQKNLKRIFYETREDSEEFLKSMKIEICESNIDFFHISTAYKTIHEWFLNKANTTEDASPRAVFAPTFLTNTKVIWYEANEPNTTPIDIFTRINIGKIPLTNAELVKAMFLHKDNFQNEKVNLKQLQIASEWDLIEKTLQDNEFWLFIYNPDNPLKYDTRIEYIFDLMKKKTKEHEFYYTFNKFQEDFEKSRKQHSKPDIDAIWLSVKKYFLTFEDWFKDHYLYHIIGFLVDCKYDLNKLKDESNGKTKDAFKDYLKSQVKKEVNCQIDELEYNDKRIKKVLLLLNIQTILASQKAEMRFPFYKYKDDDWDIEHVRSQTDKQITVGTRKDWALDVLEYLTGVSGFSDEKSEDCSEKKLQIQAIEQMSIIEDQAETYKLCKRLCDVLDAPKVNDEIFNNLYTDILKHFKESEALQNINGIANLALLDSSTNRSYKNAMFPIKRKTIIQNDKNGIFVPLCTKNLFLKYYSKKMDELMYWKEDDAKNYVEAIKNTLAEYLPNQTNGHE
jgi:uncharacterized protein with ParB-like and HNH nuclease domain